jgi:hypothetical protein
LGTRDSNIYIPVVIAIKAHEIPREMAMLGSSRRVGLRATRQ